MIKMLNDKTSPQTQEKFAFEIRREKRLNQMSAEMDEKNAKIDQMSTEMDEKNAKIGQMSTKMDEAHDFIKQMLSTDENMDENLKNKIIHLKKILNISNV